VTLWRIDRPAGAQKRLRTALCGASAPGLWRRDGFAETARFMHLSRLTCRFAYACARCGSSSITSA